MIVVPMAGLSQRFFDAGYDRPKYMLEAYGRTVFEHAVGSFARYFDTSPFLFIVRDVFDTPGFVRRITATLGIADCRIVVVDGATRGQAETVALGLERGLVPPDTPVTIFNIDTFRPGFSFPTHFDVALTDGYLEVFHGKGANWSYVEAAPGDGRRVARTTEKVPISDLCCTGLYHFRSAGAYLSNYADFASGGAEKLGLKELYVAPMYNLLIARGLDIRYDVVAADDVIFCGVPAEYEALRA